MIIVNRVLGKKFLQKFFSWLLRFSLKGLNYGNGGDFKASGELNVLYFLKKKFEKEKSLVVFDVGGNAGKYSKELSAVFGEKATIHGFEPSQKTFQIYQNTTSGCNNIIANNFGLSDTVHQQTLYTDSEGSGLASVYHRKLDHYGIAMDKTEEIQLSTIDHYCKTHEINRIHFLKLDVEGHELKALQGAEHLLANKSIDVIQFEFGGCNIDSRTYFQDFFFLLKDNYRLFRILKNGLEEMPSYNEMQEIFVTINYLAILK